MTVLINLKIKSGHNCYFNGNNFIEKQVKLSKKHVDENI